METFLRGASFTSGNFAVEETYTNWGSIELKVIALKILPKFYPFFEYSLTFLNEFKVYILIPMVVIALLFIIPLFVQVNTCHEWLRKFDKLLSRKFC